MVIDFELESGESLKTGTALERGEKEKGPCGKEGTHRMRVYCLHPAAAP